MENYGSTEFIGRGWGGGIGGLILTIISIIGIIFTLIFFKDWYT